MSDPQTKKNAVEKDEGYAWKDLLLTVGINVAQGFCMGFIGAAGAKTFQFLTRPKTIETNVVSLDTRKAI